MKWVQSKGGLPNYVKQCSQTNPLQQSNVPLKHRKFSTKYDFYMCHNCGTCNVNDTKFALSELQCGSCRFSLDTTITPTTNDM